MDLGLASPGRIPHPELFTSLAGVDEGLRCWPEVLGNREVAAESPGTLHVVLQGSSVGSPLHAQKQCFKCLQFLEAVSGAQ